MSDNSNNEENEVENNEEEEENPENEENKEIKDTENNQVNTNEKLETENEKNSENQSVLDKEKEKDNENNELNEEQINLEINENNKKDDEENKQKDESYENNIELNNNENNNNMQYNNVTKNNVQDENEQTDLVFEEKNTRQEIKQLQENLKPIYAKTKSLGEKLKELLKTLQNEIQDNNTKRKNYIKKMNEINKETKAEYEMKKQINEDMADLENLINTKINKIAEIKKLRRGKNSVERSKKELFLYKSSEDLINIKQKQLKNVSKLNNILDKDISKINFNLKRGYYIDQGIQEENPEIRTKGEELNYVYSKLITDISVIKNEIQFLKNIKDTHDKCDKKIEKLNKELEMLKERKERNINYSEFITKNREMNELKRKQIIANKGLDNFKFKYMSENNRYKNVRAISQNKVKNNYKNKIFISSEKGIINNNDYKNKHYNDSVFSSELNNNKFDMTNNENNEDLGDKYRELFKKKINERNNHIRKMNLEIKEMNEQKIMKEAELKEKENKKLSMQKSNYDLQNLKKLNEAKLKKFKKQINELKKQEAHYDILITKKELALLELKQIVESVNKIQQEMKLP